MENEERLQSVRAAIKWQPLQPNRTNMATALRVKTQLIGKFSDVDRFWAYLMEKGFYPDSPHDASWGDRYFHMRDPDGNELSFARPF